MALGPLMEEIRKKDIGTIRYTLTILYSTRSLRAGKVPSTEPIEVGCENPSFSGFTEENISLFWKEHGVRPMKSLKKVQWKSFHFSTKSGPNGHALWRSVGELYALPSSLFEEVKVCAGPSLALIMDKLLLFRDKVLRLGFPEATSIRKLSWFPDKEMKVRVVAIGDYWSQTALRPLHQHLSRILRITFLRIVPPIKDDSSKKLRAGRTIQVST